MPNARKNLCTTAGSLQPYFDSDLLLTKRFLPEPRAPLPAAIPRLLRTVCIAPCLMWYVFPVAPQTLSEDASVHSVYSAAVSCGQPHLLEQYSYNLPTETVICSIMSGPWADWPIAWHWSAFDEDRLDQIISTNTQSWLVGLTGYACLCFLWHWMRRFPTPCMQPPLATSSHLRPRPHYCRFWTGTSRSTRQNWDCLHKAHNATGGGDWHWLIRAPCSVRPGDAGCAADIHMNPAAAADGGPHYMEAW